MSIGRYVTYGNLGVISSVLTVSPNVIANAVSASGSDYIDVSNSNIESQTYIESYYVANVSTSPALTIIPDPPTAPGYDFNTSTGVWDANITLARQLKLDEARDEKTIFNQNVINCGFTVSSSGQTELMPCDIDSVNEYTAALEVIIDEQDYTANNSQHFETAAGTIPGDGVRTANVVLFAPLEISGLVKRIKDRTKYNSNVFATLNTTLNVATTPEQVANITYTFNNFV